MDIFEEVNERKDQLPVYGLGFFMLVAGLSKFVIIDFWTGYEPQFIVDLLPMTARQLTLIGGVFETLLGVMLLTGRKTFYTASLTSLWLLAITIQMAQTNFWALAIRDLGLTLYATSVALMNYTEK